MQTSLKRCGLKFSSRKDMSAKFHGGWGGRGGAGPFLAQSLIIFLLFLYSGHMERNGLVIECLTQD